MMKRDIRALIENTVMNTYGQLYAVAQLDRQKAMKVLFGMDRSGFATCPQCGRADFEHDTDCEVKEVVEQAAEALRKSLEVHDELSKEVSSGQNICEGLGFTAQETIDYAGISFRRPTADEIELILDYLYDPIENLNSPAPLSSEQMESGRATAVGEMELSAMVLDIANAKAKLFHFWGFHIAGYVKRRGDNFIDVYGTYGFAIFQEEGQWTVKEYEGREDIIFTL